MKHKRKLGLMLVLAGMFLILLQPLSEVTGFSVASDSIFIVKNVWFILSGLGMILVGTVMMAGKADLVDLAESETALPELDFTPSQYFRFLVEDWILKHPKTDKIQCGLNRFIRDNQHLLQAYGEKDIDGALNKVYSDLRQFQMTCPGFIKDLTTIIKEKEAEKPIREQLSGIVKPTIYTSLLNSIKNEIGDPTYLTHKPPILYGENKDKKGKIISYDAPEVAIQKGIKRSSSNNLFRVFAPDEDNPSKKKETIFAYVPNLDDARILCHQIIGDLAKEGKRVIFPLYELQVFPTKKNPKSILYNKFQKLLDNPESAEGRDLINAIKIAKQNNGDINIQDIGLAIGEEETRTGGLRREAYYHRDRPHIPFGIRYSHYNFHTPDVNVHVLYGNPAP